MSPDWLDDHSFPYSYIKSKGIYPFDASLGIKVLLEPSKKYVIRVLYLKVDPSQWRSNIIVDKPDKHKIIFTDVYFETPDLNNQEQEAYNWILEKKITKPFTSQSFSTDFSDVELQILKEFAHNFPDVPFTEWAIMHIFKNIMRSVYQSKSVSDDDIKLASRYAEVLLKSEVEFFRYMAMQDLRELKKVQKKQRE